MRRLALLLMVFLLAPFASARYITISVGLLSSGFISGNSGVLNISVSNFGDEPAYDVQLGFDMPEGFASEPIFVGVINPNNTALASFNINISDNVVSGEYYLNLIVQYADGNGYPFSMVNPVKVVYRTPAQIMVNGVMEKVEIPGGGSGNLRLVLNNPDNIAHDLSVRLYLPNEIKADSSERKVSIPPKGEVDVDYELSSFGALPGSNYMVYAVVDYVDDLHRSNAVRTNVVITAEKSLFGSFPLWIPAAGAILLVLVLFYMQLKPRVKQKNKNR
ncbi:MAG: hypothetical protein V1703_04810 [Candidatus Altiarchaeota archaeon]